MSDNLKILYVTPTLVALPHTGSMIRSMNIARQLKNSGQVTMLAVARKFVEGSIELAKKDFDNIIFVKLKDYPEYGDYAGRFLRKFHMHWPWSRGTMANDQDQKLFLCR